MKDDWDYKRVQKIVVVVFLVILVIESIAFLISEIVADKSILLILHFVLFMISIWLMSFFYRKYIRTEYPEYWLELISNNSNFDNYWSSRNWEKVYQHDQKNGYLDSMRRSRTMIILVSVVFLFFPLIY